MEQIGMGIALHGVAASQRRRGSEGVRDLAQLPNFKHDMLYEWTNFMLYDTRKSLYITSFTLQHRRRRLAFFLYGYTKHELDRSSGYKDTILGIGDFTPFRA